MTSKRNISLSSEHLYALREFSFLDSCLVKVIDRWVPVGKKTTLYAIPVEVCEEIRSLLTNILAETGFDESYELTPKGQKLEELIDRFATDDQ